MNDTAAPRSKIKIAAIREMATSAALAATDQAWTGSVVLRASSRGEKILRLSRLAEAATLSQAGSQLGP